LYGSEFQPSVAPLLIMLPGMIAISAYAIVEPFFQSRRRPWIPVQITAGGLAANLLLCFVLIPRHGILGAAVSYTLSYGTQLCLACFALARYAGRPITEPIDILAAMRSAAHWLRTRSHSWVERSASGPE